MTLFAALTLDQRTRLDDGVVHEQVATMREELQEQVDAWVQPMWDATSEDRRHLLRMTNPDLTTYAREPEPGSNEVTIVLEREHPVVWCQLPEPEAADGG